MNVLALIEEPDHVCYRYRIEAFAWALAERGMHLQAAPLERQTLRRFALAVLISSCFLGPPPIFKRLRTWIY